MNRAVATYSHDRQVGVTTGTMVHCWTATVAGHLASDDAIDGDGHLLGHADRHLSRGRLGDHPAGSHGHALDAFLRGVAARGHLVGLDPLLGDVVAGLNLVGLDPLFVRHSCTW